MTVDDGDQCLDRIYIIAPKATVIIDTRKRKAINKTANHNPENKYLIIIKFLNLFES